MAKCKALTGSAVKGLTDKKGGLFSGTQCSCDLSAMSETVGGAVVEVKLFDFELRFVLATGVELNGVLSLVDPLEPDRIQ